MSKIAFIGLGHMGTPMVKNLLNAGHQVKVYDVQADAIKNLVTEGAIAASSLQEVAQDAEIIFTMVQKGEQVKAICLSEHGAFSTAKPGTLFIDSSSIDVDTSRELHAAAIKHGFVMLDAPVSGGVAGAEKAALTIMVGGEETIFEKAKPILDVLGKTIVHAGPAGNGQAAKICNNMILGISMIAVAEGFTLAKKLGLDPKKLFAISSHASGQCWSMTSYNPVPGLVEGSPANNDYQPGFTSNMMLKDLNLSQDAAKATNTTTPLGANATSLYSNFVNQGNGNLDFSGIIKLINPES